MSQPRLMIFQKQKSKDKEKILKAVRGLNILPVVMDGIVSPPTFTCEVLTPNVAVFGERAFREVIKGK